MAYRRAEPIDLKYVNNNKSLFIEKYKIALRRDLGKGEGRKEKLNRREPQDAEAFSTLAIEGLVTK
ncbi:MAG: hypothetical protein D6680_04885 [Cyanobacteria bacterium J007]|nr:MAG: hypothetical protein D6680_04885 [Cyanobacteria bacterium J007]